MLAKDNSFRAKHIDFTIGDIIFTIVSFYAVYQLRFRLPVMYQYLLKIGERFSNRLVRMLRSIVVFPSAGEEVAA